jgi:hypothetical protein
MTKIIVILGIFMLVLTGPLVSISLAENDAFITNSNAMHDNHHISLRTERRGFLTNTNALHDEHHINMIEDNSVFKKDHPLSAVEDSEVIGDNGTLYHCTTLPDNQKSCKSIGTVELFRRETWRP